MHFDVKNIIHFVLSSDG